MTKEFFLVVPPGSEEEAEKELLEVSSFLVDLEGWPMPSAISNIKQVKGGIEFEAPIAAGLQLHYWLKIPVRILMRLFYFKCKDRRDFKKPLEKATWNEWLRGTPANIKVESTASSVWNESWVQDEVSSFLKKKFADKTSPSTIYFRAMENQWTVSIDLTGEPLFKRGWATLKEKAPLRENLAILGLRDLIGESYQDMADVTLADPFLGSGTILAEGFHLNDLQVTRDYSFESEPFCPKLLKDKKIISNYRVQKPEGFKNYFGSEIEAKTFSTAEENLKELPTKDLKHASFNTVKPSGRVWVLTNPPYEKRVQIKGMQADDWLQELIQKWKPERLTFFFPKDRIKELSWPSEYELINRRILSHGGMTVQVSTLFVKQT